MIPIQWKMKPYDEQKMILVPNDHGQRVVNVEIKMMYINNI